MKQGSSTQCPLERLEYPSVVACRSETWCPPQTLANLELAGCLGKPIQIYGEGENAMPCSERLFLDKLLYTYIFIGSAMWEEI